MIKLPLKLTLFFSFITLFPAAKAHVLSETNSEHYITHMQHWVDTRLAEGKLQSKHKGTSGQDIELAYTQAIHQESLAEKAKHRKCVFIIQGLMENYFLYARLIKNLFEQGYDVVTFDLRSQGNSGRTIQDEQKIHLEDFQAYIDDMKTVYKYTIENFYDNVYLYSHSTGGLILQEFLHQNPCVPVQKVAMVAPLLAFNDRVVDTVSTRLQKAGVGIAACCLCERPLTLSKLHTLAYDIYAQNNPFAKLIQRQMDYYLDDINLMPEAFFPNQRAFQAYDFESSFMQHLTSSRTQYEWLASVYRKHEALRVGGATNAWLRTTSKAIRTLKKHKHPFDHPTLIIKASLDKIVYNPAIDKYVQRLYKKAKHTPKVIQIDSRHGVHLEHCDIFYKQLMPAVLDFFG